MSAYLLRTFQCLLNIESFSHEHSIQFLLETEQFDVGLRFRYQGTYLLVDDLLGETLALFSRRYTFSDRKSIGEDGKSYCRMGPAPGAFGFGIIDGLATMPGGYPMGKG